MEIEEMVKKIDTKQLKEEAKKRGIKTSCVRKVDIAKQLPAEVLERLAK
jgi:BioD-like phosphotransacetylase family protein